MVGTSILLAATVILVAGVVVSLTGSEAGPSTLPRLDLKASAGASDPGMVTLTHAGGPPLRMEDLRVVADVAGAPYKSGPFPASGAWSLGESVRVPLDRPLVGGERLDVTVVSAPLGAVLATASVDVSRAGASSLASSTFTLTLSEPAASPVPEVLPGSTFRIVAQVAHEDGRKAVLSVLANMSETGGSSVIPLYDDGSHGDTRAGDLNYTAYVVVPPEAQPSFFSLPVHAVALDGARTPGNAAAQIVVRIVAANVTEPPGPPFILSFSPATGPPNTKVTVLGLNLSYANSVSLVNAATGSAHGATWWVGSDSELFLLPPPSAPTGADYRVAVTSPLGSDVSDSTFRLTALSGTSLTPPTMLGFSPTRGGANTEVALTGADFTYATSVTLSRNGVSFAAPFWNVGETGSELHLLVPRGLASGDYVISVFNPSGNATSACCVPPTFFVTPPDPLSVFGFTPRTGPPYTTVTLLGEGLSQSVAVTLGGVGVNYWIVDDGELQFITHAGIPLGNQSIVVYNATGSRSFCCFEALANPDEIEYSVYGSSLFDHVGHTTTKVGTSPNGDKVRSTLKFDLAQDAVVSGSDTYHLDSVTLVYQPFKPGDVGRVLMPTTVCSPTAAVGARLGVWVVQVETEIPNFVMDEDSFRYFYEVKWSNGLSGGRHVESVFYIDSSITQQYFNLRQRDTTKTVIERDNWPANLTDCTDA
jgi:hypothetical protein